MLTSHVPWILISRLEACYHLNPSRGECNEHDASSGARPAIPRHTRVSRARHILVHYICTKERPVLRDVSFTIHMSSHMGMIGLNGCGKSTLFKLVTDVLPPGRGTVSCYPRLKLGYYSQLAVET